MTARCVTLLGTSGVISNRVDGDDISIMKYPYEGNIDIMSYSTTRQAGSGFRPSQMAAHPLKPDWVYWLSNSPILKVQRPNGVLEITVESSIARAYFINGGSHFFACDTSGWYIFDSSTWERLYYSGDGTTVMLDADISQDGSHVIERKDTTPCLNIYAFNISTLVKGALVSSPAHSGASSVIGDDGDITGFCFSGDNTKVLMSANSSNYVSELFDVATGASITYYNNAAYNGYYGRVVNSNPAGSKAAWPSYQIGKINVYDFASESLTGFTAVPQLGPISHITSTVWAANNTELFFAWDSYPSAGKLNTVTGEFTYFDGAYNPVGLVFFSHLASVDSEWAISGTISESLVNDTWMVQVSEASTGEFVSVEEITGTSFTINVPNGDAKMVTVMMATPDEWEADTVVELDQLIVPTDSVTNPIYLKCTTAGTTGSTEPSWNATASATNSDGAAVWQTVERLIQPVTQQPVNPVPVV